MSSDITSSTAIEVVTANGSYLLEEFRATIMGLLTALTCRIFQVLHVRPSIVWTVESSTDFWSSSMDNVHGRLHCRPSMDNVHGRPYYCPWETSSIMNHILLHEPFLVSLSGSWSHLFSWTWTILMDELEMN